MGRYIRPNCHKCGAIKYMLPSGRLSGYCKPCWCLIQKAWLVWSPDRIQHARERHRRWELMHPEKKREYDRRYYRRHHKEILVRASGRRPSPEKQLEYTRRYRMTHRDLTRSFVRNRRARLRGAVGCHSGQDIQRLLWFQSGLCQYCGQRLERYTVDHLVPLIHGGSNWPSNLCLACLSCNSRKGSKTAVEFFSLLDA